MKKGLIATFMVSLMLLTVLSGVVGVNAISVSEETTEENNDSKDLGFSFIWIYIMLYDMIDRDQYIPNWVTFELTDLDTGEVRRAFRYFGNILFILLPMGHDYEFKFSCSKVNDTWIIKDLGFFYFKNPVYYGIFE